MRIVAALGGNALLERGEAPEARIQLTHVRRAAQALAPLAAEHELIICHGNGPQVGMLAMESESDPAISRPYPLDVLVAQTQGMIGYWLSQELRNAGVGRPVVAVVSQTVVAAHDPAFASPAKFIGAGYEQQAARQLADEHAWTFQLDGQSWRRVVPSPEPVDLVELPVVAGLVSSGTVVVYGGGGGSAVVEDGGRLAGVEAVVDKDLVAELLAERLDADVLLLLTDVPAVMRDFGTGHATPIERVDPVELATMRFPAGSMGPKVEACLRFTTREGRRAAIGNLTEAERVLAGTAGTTVTRSAPVSSARPEPEPSRP